MKLIENDVRLIRRYLVALNFDDMKSANLIVGYLRNIKKLYMVLPSEYTTFERDRYLNRLLGKEQWLAKKWGCVLLPDYDGKGSSDCIFLNSRWGNPYTLYVRLIEPVEHLRELGDIYWLPKGKAKFWPELADKNHEMYMQAAAKVLLNEKIEALKAQEIEVAKEQERAFAREVEKALELEAIALAKEQEEAQRILDKEQEEAQRVLDEEIAAELVRQAAEEAAKPWWKKLLGM